MRFSFPWLPVLVAFSLLLTATSHGPPAVAQSSTEKEQALNLTIGNVGVSIGDSERTTGLRLNYRDRALRRATGVSLTLWRPYDDAVGGTVNGLAVGLPLTGAERVRGLGIGGGVRADTAMDGVMVGVLGLGSGERLSGIAVGGLGVGAGGRTRGLLIGGLGAGAGHAADGLLLGGLGAGAGGTSNGILVGGLGAGAGEHARGLLLGGLGAGAGESVSGVLVGGAGAGAGEHATGVLVGGLGAGAGGRATGLLVGGLAVGAGDRMTGIGLSLGAVGAGDRFSGIGLGGVAVGAGDEMTGLAVAGVGVGSSNLTGLFLTGGYARVQDGALRGVSLSGWNDIRGTQRGLTIGIYNYTRELRGIQIGLLNVAHNNPVWARVLPGLNLNL